jgi:hypothetical protein
MKLVYNISILLMALFYFGDVTAQIQVEEEGNLELTGVVIHADPRLDILTKKKMASPGVIRSGRGFRVQIYNGNDRGKANNIKMDFMRRFPGVRVYMSYVQPQFRVKAGDFRSRADAHKLSDQLNSLYSPVMIVPDIIVINTLKDDKPD